MGGEEEIENVYFMPIRVSESEKKYMLQSEIQLLSYMGQHLLELFCKAAFFFCTKYRSNLVRFFMHKFDST